MNRLHDHVDRTQGNDGAPEVVLNCIGTLLRSCWAETGFGGIAIESERIRPDVIRVIVRGTVSYIFHVRG